MRTIAFFAASVLLLFVGQVNAQPRWDTGVIPGNEGVWAAATSSSGVAFGRYCYYRDNSCVWMLGNKLTCVPGDSYPALASASKSAHVQLVCAGKNEAFNRYFLTPYDTVEGLVLGGGILGIAAVSESGEFQVFRFDLRDATRALNEADAMYQSGTRTKDQKL
jgi:hypothetical protein